MKENNFRHGDVLIKQSTIPDGAIESKTDKIVLAEGETTGHAHRIMSGKCMLMKFNEKTYLKVLSKIAKVDHEEHGLREIPKGDYEIIIQNDYEPQGWKRIID